ncbi:MAG TPA: glycoside hydrolase family 20 zincin-like fold domain-containing protein [Granulicella sp.]|nr:glycoside hydrolase family 20 zincin-like fold domain-containing protein [Granulicella sp.]
MASSRSLAALFAATLAACSGSLAQTPAPLHLIPMPRELRPLPDQPLPHGVRILCPTAASDSDDKFAAADLARSLNDRGISTTDPAGLVIDLTRLSAHPAAKIAADFDAAMKPEGYLITTAPGALTVTAESAAGLFYGAQTVKQLIERTAGTPAVLHAADIRDWPAMQYRGLDDDLSRGPVTTLAFEKKLIRTLAAYKINLYSPYFEHTAAYATDPLFAPPGGAITPADAAALVAYARPYHITIVPEQEAFGHLHHNLTWEQYQPLAETPHGAVLAPNQPGTLALSTRMLTQLAAEYPSPFLHIGADETVDLGLGQTKADVDARGLAPVYLDYMQRLVTALQPLHRKLLFWGDIAQDAPDLLKQLPPSFKASTIAIAWVYTPEPRGYDRFLTPFTNAGFETWVAPSVTNYRKVYPDNNISLLNIQEFVRDGQRLGSTGMLNTIWNDDGEGLFNQDWYGILFGAAAAWQKGQSSIPDFENSYAQVFHNDQTGKLNQAQLELMAAHDILKNEAHVGDASNSLFWLDPFSKDGQRIGGQMRPFIHDLRLHAEAALTLIAQAKAAAGLKPQPADQPEATGTFYDSVRYGAASSNLENPDAVDAMELGARRMDFIGLEYQLADEIAQGYQRAYALQNSTDKKDHAQVSRELSDINGINGRIEDIRDTFSLLRDMYEAAWLRSNRPYALRPVLEHYDYTVGIWLGRSDRVRSALRQWNDTHTLPPAADLGIPAPPS